MGVVHALGPGSSHTKCLLGICTQVLDQWLQVVAPLGSDCSSVYTNLQQRPSTCCKAKSKRTSISVARPVFWRYADAGFEGENDLQKPSQRVVSNTPIRSASRCHGLRAHWKTLAILKKSWLDKNGVYRGTQRNVYERQVNRAWCVRLLHHCSGCGSSADAPSTLQPRRLEIP